MRSARGFLLGCMVGHFVVMVLKTPNPLMVFLLLSSTFLVFENIFSREVSA